MPKAGDSYQIELKEAHLNWGEHRNPTNRDLVGGEAYIPIPKRRAKEFHIYNSNHKPTGAGYNLFTVSSHDGFLNHETLRAQGSSVEGDIYAKQFSIDDNLKRIGHWYQNQNVQVGDIVQVTWHSPTEVIVEIIR